MEFFIWGLGFFVSFICLYTGISSVISRIVLWFKVSKSRNWPSTNGTVLDTGFHRVLTGTSRDRRTTSFIPYVKYQYSAFGQQIESEQIKRIKLKCLLMKKAKRITAPYQTGQQVMVFYNPQNPRECAIQNDFTKDNGMEIFWGFVRILLSAAGGYVLHLFF